ncbi:TPA: hypothetical protein N0F65_011478 [Lagenidium giganteum]|uniref:Uncharacterized protein n=1 Tax=Lagenidium giganteum TaxID=4803 RepID=A0AAV2ZA00_9STRA|nr:TPA: hypothetical protein N0F65_011478 [Lagenidium giganteum]
MNLNIASDSLSDEDADSSSDWSDSSDTSSNDGGDRDRDHFDTDIDAMRRPPKAPSTPILRQRRGRNSIAPTGLVTDSALAQHPVTAYANALRALPKTGGARRESLSVKMNPDLGPHLHRRHRESKKRVECVERLFHVLQLAQRLEATVQDLSLWLHAHVIPPSWRGQIVAHIQPLSHQMLLSRAMVLAAWAFVLPPFDKPNFAEFERRLRNFTLCTQYLNEALSECREKVVRAEQVAACCFVQAWFRQCLAKRGFYTKLLRLRHTHRGLIPGLFDTIPGQSKLATVPKSRHFQALLEYPTGPTDPPQFAGMVEAALALAAQPSTNNHVTHQR